MQDVRFFDRAGPFTIAEIAGWTGAEIGNGDAAKILRDAATLDLAGPDDVAFFDNPRYRSDLAATGAGACLVSARHAGLVPQTAVALVVGAPSQAFAEILRRFYPAALRPTDIWGEGDPPSAMPAIHPSARLETGAVVEPGAIVGAEARIGAGTRILAGSVIGRRVHVGRNCTIGPGASAIHAIIGDRVIVHPGVRLGQDGFGYVMGPGGHAKVPQIGRVVIQDDVEIGANTTIDRGALRDTVIGEGTKIDNLVQIGHNVVIGRHCVIVGQVGIAGSARLGDFVAIGGQAGVMTHVSIGDGAQVAALSAVRDDLPAGGQYGGVPARPAREWLREVAALHKLARRQLSKAPREHGREPDDE